MTHDVGYALYLFRDGHWKRDRSFGWDQRNEAVAATRSSTSGNKAIKTAALVEETQDPKSGNVKQEVVFALPASPSIPDLATTLANARSRRRDDAPAPRRVFGDGIARDPRPRPKRSKATLAIVAVCVGLPLVYILSRVAGPQLMEFLGGQSLIVVGLVVVLGAVLWAARASLNRAADGPGPDASDAVAIHAEPDSMSDSAFAPEDVATAAPASHPASATVTAADQPRPKSARKKVELTAVPAADPKPVAAADAAPADAPVAPDIAGSQRDVGALVRRSHEFLRICGSRFLKDGRLDPQVQLGHDLFVLGAADAVDEDKLSPARVRDLMAAALKAAGRPTERASELARNHEGYLLEARNLDIFRAGREAIATMVHDDKLIAKAADGTLKPAEEKHARDERHTDIGMFLENALDAWQSRGSAPGGAILFGGGTITAVVTAVVVPLPPATGDNTPRRVLTGFHDQTVRDALKEFGGQEIKRMLTSGADGDTIGLLVTFNDPLRAIEAAATMQRAAGYYSRANPDLPLPLRIAIAAGRPLVGKDGLTGSPVPEAIRLCATAGAGHIVASKLVRGQCAGTSVQFIEPPANSLARDGRMGFLIEWSESAEAAAAMQPPVGVPPMPSPRAAGNA